MFCELNSLGQELNGKRLKDWSPEKITSWSNTFKTFIKAFQFVIIRETLIMSIQTLLKVISVLVSNYQISSPVPSSK